MRLMSMLVHSRLVAGQQHTQATWGSLPADCSVVAVTDPGEAASDQGIGCWVDGCNDPWGGGGCPKTLSLLWTQF